MNPAQADIASKLTIVLTLKDRPEFTRRWMRYMDDNRCPYKILIADGGADKAIEEQLRDSGNYPNLDYEYIRYPFDENFRCFYTKQLDVCRRVKSDYLLLADNDDFFIIDTIPLLIDFLDGHPDYSGCRGTYSQFTLFSKDGGVVNTPVGERYTTEPSECYSIENESSLERAECFFKKVDRYYLWLNWYSVFRTGKVCHSLETIYKHNFPDVVLNELLLNLLLLREGKLKVIDQLFYVRQLGASQSSASISADNNVLESFLIKDAFHHFNDFILQEHFVAGESERIRVLKAFAYYIGIFCTAHYHPEPLVKVLPAEGHMVKEAVEKPVVIETPAREPVVAELPVKENLKQKFKRAIKKNEMLYFLAREAAHLYRTLHGSSKAQESHPEIATPAIESTTVVEAPANEIPVVANHPGIRIPAIESYVLNNPERLSAR